MQWREIHAGYWVADVADTHVSVTRLDVYGDGARWLAVAQRDGRSHELCRAWGRDAAMEMAEKLAKRMRGTWLDRVREAFAWIGG